MHVILSDRRKSQIFKGSRRIFAPIYLQISRSCEDPSTRCVYLAFCWTVFPICMTIVDVIEYIPMKPDEEGYILV